MTGIEQCLVQVAAVRQSASDPKAAYLIRSRLERLLLSCARVIAQRSDIVKPDLPGPVATADLTEDVQSLADACETLYRLSSSICRPSEALDARWDEGWSRISPALDELERLLVSQRS
jgi:hypothetical protein